MERKTSNLRNKIAKLLSLPHATPSITAILVSPPLSPRKPSSTKPVYTSIIPSEARRKPKYGSSFDTREPTSPKVSCLGQITNKKKPKPKPKKVGCSVQEVKVVKKRHKKGVKENMIIDDGPNSKDKADGSNVGILVVPSLGEMKRFTSARGVLSEF
ncbi:hypothetical protein L484_026613 [Morus notabilis]|uniref:Uncharacterized protein n=1 Tax=Morus notabilis TaxID=981085 RepID=W9SKF7_9ROSA|nr:uncharacterized protein At1g76070 [Morus notabilis]EXC35291.1 hypothetical protein L484_026613 [Morus notabilis]